MFRGESDQRTHRQNIALAGVLALVSGIVNVLGLLRAGVFSSHITGRAGELSLALTSPSERGFWLTALHIFTFFVGAAVACATIEAVPWKTKPRAYSFLLIVEASLLLSATMTPPHQHWSILSLFLAMGLQNGLVTRLSGAVVRTTHLTGVVTDLGIETARWIVLAFSKSLRRLPGESHQGGSEAGPNLPKSLLLLTILLAFMSGGVLGASLFSVLKDSAFILPIGLLLIGGALAFRNGMQMLGPENRR